MELWDAYDSKLNKIDGVTLVRGEQIPDGYFHLCSEIIVKVDDLRIEIDNQWYDSIKNYYSNEENPCKKYYEEVSDHLPIGMKITYGR